MNTAVTVEVVGNPQVPTGRDHPPPISSHRPRTRRSASLTRAWVACRAPGQSHAHALVLVDGQVVHPAWYYHLPVRRATSRLPVKSSLSYTSGRFSGTTFQLNGEYVRSSVPATGRLQVCTARYL
jgi:hypothetical protein